jgi:hypothetical protein
MTKTRITAKFYEDEFKAQTNFRPGDPEPTMYEQVAGWMSAVDLAVGIGTITKCAAKFIRRMAAEFVREEFHARLTPAQTKRMVEMGDNAAMAMEEETFNNALRGLLEQAGLSNEDVDAVLSEPSTPTEVPQAKASQSEPDWTSYAEATEKAISSKWPKETA